MSRRKCLHMDTGSFGVLYSLLCFIYQLQPAFPFSIFSRPGLNCSQLCTCTPNSVEDTMRIYNHRHFAHMGAKYRPELTFFESHSEYMLFLGTFTTMLRNIVIVSCELSDGLSHSIMTILNGVDDVMYTALEVKCRKGEDLVWDVPSWLTSLNIFVSEHCKIVNPEDKATVTIPMNMWILDIEKGGHNLLDTLDLRYTMNTLAFAVMGSRSSLMPYNWRDKYMTSAALINLRDNSLEDYDCSLLFTKKLDTLNLENNRLYRFPECVLDSRQMKIEYLSLAGNEISDLTPIYEAPESNKQPDISIINLFSNKVRNVEAIREMDSLVTLDLSHNVIRELSEDAFVNLWNIEKLYLSHNRIQSLSSKLFLSNTKLEYIDLSNNALTVVYPNVVPIGQSALEMDFRVNDMGYPPFKACAKDNVQRSYLKVLASDNPYVCDCHMIDFELCQTSISERQINKTKHRLFFADLNAMTCASPHEMKDQVVADVSFTSRCIVQDNCPPFCACTLLNVENLVVNCSSRRLLEMPDILPSYPNANVILYLDHNPLQMLSYRGYLRTLSELHVDNCLLTSVTPAAISALQNIRVMTLHNNLLQKLPSSTRNITLNHAKNVTLHNNRWACSCDSLWLPRWITKHKSSLWMPGNIVCNYLRKPVEELNEMDLNCTSSSYVDTFLAISLALSSLVSTLVIVFYYRSEINVLLYSKLGLRLGYSFSYGDFFNPYDAFLSYSQDNYRWVVDTLVPHLENGPRKYRLCLHFRDFPAGESVVDNIPWAIRLSRCAVLVLSKDFLKREWGIMEVRAAFQRLLLVSNRLIIIATDDINIDDLSPDLRAYMNTHDYLRVGEPCFWDKLEMFLPPKPLAKEEETVQSMSRSGGGDSVAQCDTEKFEDICQSDNSEMSLRLQDMDHNF